MLSKQCKFYTCFTSNGVKLENKERRNLKGEKGICIDLIMQMKFNGRNELRIITKDPKRRNGNKKNIRKCPSFWVTFL